MEEIKEKRRIVVVGKGIVDRTGTKNIEVLNFTLIPL